MSSVSRQSGFTLLEVLLATFISSIILIGSYSVLSSVLNTNERVSEKRLALKNVQRALHFMQQDFEQILPRAVKGELGEAKIIDYKSFDSRLEFTRLGWRNPIERSRSKMQRVAYFVDDEILIREHWNTLDRADNEESKKNPILPGAKDIKFRFYDLKDKQWRSEWDPESSDEQKLPAAIEIKIQTKNYGELRRVFRIVDNRVGDYDADT